MLAEPRPSRYDIHFSVARVPVSIHPMFWLVTGLIGIISYRGEISLIVLWIAAVFVSILVHELGHAFAIRAHGWKSRVTLYAMGGLAHYEPSHTRGRDTHKSRILISAAGPGAGFVLGGLILLALVATGHGVALPGLEFLGIGDGSRSLAVGGRLGVFVQQLLFVNIFWGLLNLVPIQPLDGGAIAHSLFAKYGRRDAFIRSLQLSVATSAVVGIAGMMVFNSVFIVIMFAMLGFQNWQLLQQAKTMR